MQSNQFFGTEKPLRLYFKVAIPGMISMLAMSIYGVIEGVFIGQLLGEAAFAAINLAMPFVMINFSLADLVGVGSSVPISIALGRKDEKRANNLFSCSLVLIFLAAVFMGILLFFGAPLLMKLMGAEGKLAELAIRYVRVYALMGPVTTLVFAMDNYLRICGYVRTSMVLNIFMSVLMVVLLYLFIDVGGMDVDGSALATSIAMALCAILALLPFLFKKTLLKIVRPRFSWEAVRQIVTCGAPTFLNNIAGRVAAIVMNVALLRVGGQTAVAAYSVLMYAGEVIQPMLYGLSDSVQPAIGYNWGGRSLERVRSLGKCAIMACGVVSILGTAVMYFFPEPICRLFVKAEETALMEMSVQAMGIFGLAFLFRWFGFAVQSFFSAIEKPGRASILSVANALVFPVLLIFILQPLGLNGLWLNMAGTSALVAILAVFMMLGMQKRMKRDIEK